MSQSIAAAVTAGGSPLRIFIGPTSSDKPLTRISSNLLVFANAGLSAINFLYLSGQSGTNFSPSQYTISSLSLRRKRRTKEHFGPACDNCMLVSGFPSLRITLGYPACVGALVKDSPPFLSL